MQIWKRDTKWGSRTNSCLKTGLNRSNKVWQGIAWCVSMVDRWAPSQWWLVHIFCFCWGSARFITVCREDIRAVWRLCENAWYRSLSRLVQTWVSTIRHQIQTCVCPVTVNRSCNILLWTFEQAQSLVIARGHKCSSEGRTALLAICKSFEVR